MLQRAGRSTVSWDKLPLKGFREVPNFWERRLLSKITALTNDLKFNEAYLFQNYLLRTRLEKVLNSLTMVIVATFSNLEESFKDGRYRKI